MSRVLAVIPARWGSTRFPGKPLHVIAGKPLVQHVWERCGAARCLDEIVVATDDRRIAEAAAGFGATVVMTSARHRSGTDRIAEVVRRRPRITHVLNVQGDEPLVSPKLLDRLVRTLVKEKVDMITAASPFGPEEDVAIPHAVKVVTDLRGLALYFSRSPIPFVRQPHPGLRLLRHQGIYGYTRSCLLQFARWRPTVLECVEQLEQLRALEHGLKLRVLVAPPAPPGVDTPEDVAAVERLLRGS
jgi:3-deoxy-manno-octulosonate cytidylyltransferase (CMP-KDO synthetase)